MTRWILAAGAAALAIATPALAGPGGHSGGNGGGNGGERGGGPGGGHGQEAKAEHQARGGGAMQFEHARSAPAMRVEHGGHGAMMRAARVERGPSMRAAHFEQRQTARAAHVGHGAETRVAHVEHGQAMRAENANAWHAQRQADNRVWARDVRPETARIATTRTFEPRFGTQGLANGLIDGCPPGLAAKNNGCLPPGQAKKLVGTALPAAYAQSLLSGPYSSWYPDNQRYTYRMGSDYIYRVDRSSNLIDALIPAVDRNYSYYPVGQMYPSDFNFYNVPYQYQSYYPDGGNMLYRYGDGAIYGLDPQTQAVQSIVALLAGDLGVGQPLPIGYSAYNLPLQYRSQYYDTPNDWYRYNDGYIYRVDPKTQLITAVINALV